MVTLPLTDHVSDSFRERLDAFYGFSETRSFITAIALYSYRWRTDNDRNRWGRLLRTAMRCPTYEGDDDE